MNVRLRGLLTAKRTQACSKGVMTIDVYSAEAYLSYQSAEARTIGSSMILRRSHKPLGGVEDS